MARTFLPVVVLTTLAAACTAGEITTTTAGYVDDGSGIPTFREFEEQTYREPGPDGVYIVNGDTSIPDEKQLREYYERLFHKALTVNQINGADTKWPQGLKSNLSYCVSDSFGQYKQEVVDAMRAATEEGWQLAADLHFVYDPSQDGNCNASNNNVLFDVRPTQGAPYLARAFFPGYARYSRNVIIDTSSFVSGWPLRAILAHELGHVLGFRHEHTRPEAGTCFEDNDWRPLTPYDVASIMHYPHCNGVGNSLSFSQSDFDGAASFYGAPSGESSTSTPPPSAGSTQTGSASGSVAKNEAQHYQPIQVLAGTTVTVDMSGSGDADLYLRFGAQPTATAYDCRPFLNGSNETCSVDVPAGASEAYLMVHGYTDATYQLSLSWTAP